MRIIRIKLKSDVKEYLKTICKRYSVSDSSFVEDTFALVRTKGGGLPDDARTKKLADFYAVDRKVLPIIAKAMINKRKQILKKMITTALFQRFALGSSSLTDMEFTELLLSSFQKLHKKIRQSQCMTCMYLTKCDFGKQYGNKVKDILIVIDPDYSKKVNPSCPHQPEIDFINQMNTASSFINEVASDEGAASLTAANQYGDENASSMWGQGANSIATKEELGNMIKAEEEALKQELALDSDLEYLEEDEEEFPAWGGSGASKGNDPYNVNHLLGSSMILDDKTIDAIKVSSLMIYELSKKLGTLLSKSKKGQYSEVQKVTKERKHTEIKSVHEVTKVIPKEHAESNEVFDAKLAKKQLIKKQHQEPQAKRQLLYVLLDESSSMNAKAGLGGVLGFITRAALAASFTIALSRRVCDDGGMIFFRGFNTSVSELRSCKEVEQHRSLEQWIAGSSFRGGGTMIHNALKTAFTDITTNQGDISKAEILIVTDADDSFTAKEKKDFVTWFKTVPLNILDVAGGKEFASASADCLRAIADNYFKVDSSKNSIQGMVDLVGSKKKAAK